MSLPLDTPAYLRGRSDFKAGVHENPFDYFTHSDDHRHWINGYRAERALAAAASNYVAHRVDQERFES